MPKSQFVSASRLRGLLIYCAVAFVALLLADALVQAVGGARGTRRLVAVAWLVLFPSVGWLVWRRG